MTLQSEGRRLFRRANVQSASLLAVVLSLTGAFGLNNGLCPTPPMGWNPFNSFGGDWPAEAILAAADSLVSTGLRDVGYIYCNNDGNNAGTTPYWPGKPGYVAWASPIADYIHARGLKFGTYMTTTTDAPAVAADLEAAKVDYLKHDDWTRGYTDPVFSNVRNALMASTRPIVYSMHSASEVITPDLAHLSRTGADITADWPKIMDCYDKNYPGLSSSGPGGWADPDMLETGCRTTGGWVLSDDENRAHFSMWCMMASPLLIGYDITRTFAYSRTPTLTQHVQTMSIFSNAELIAVDQDPLGKAGKRIKGQGNLEVWVKQLSDSTRAVAFFNRTGSTGNASITKAELGWGTSDTIYVRDLWLHQDQPPITATFTKSVKSHAAEIYRLSPHPITGVEQQLRKMDRAVWWLEQNGYSVFPRKMVLNVMQGTIPGARVFDLRGRALSVDPRAVGTGAYVIRASAGDRSIAAKMMWPGMSR